MLNRIYSTISAWLGYNTNNSQQYTKSTTLNNNNKNKTLPSITQLKTYNKSRFLLVANENNNIDNKKNNNNNKDSYRSSNIMNNINSNKDQPIIIDDDPYLPNKNNKNSNYKSNLKVNNTNNTDINNNGNHQNNNANYQNNINNNNNKYYSGNNANQLQNYYYKLIQYDNNNNNTQQNNNNNNNKQQQCKQQQQQLQQTQQFYRQHTTLQDNITTLNTLFNKLIVSDTQVIQHIKQLNKYDRMMNQNRSNITSNGINNKKQLQIYRQYHKNIKIVLDTKYKYQLDHDYQQITYQQYKYIYYQVWYNNSNNNNANGVVQGYDHLTYKHLRTLAFGQWLNDQIISHYIKLLEEKYQQGKQQQISVQCKILNSLQSQSIFDKADHNKIRNILKRRGINLPIITNNNNNSNNNNTSNIVDTKSVIMAIHKVNHWLFIKVNILNRVVIIYDSLPMSNTDQYLKNSPTIRNIVNFFSEHLRKIDNADLLQIKICRNYPKQNNGYDCGVMMLCGIRDLMMNYGDEEVWTFTQRDIKYKRMSITHQLMKKKIYP